MNTVISKDGTKIAYETHGKGPSLIIVDGALNYRAFGTGRPLAKLLKEHFTVYVYDRRGRGDSTDTKPYAIEREVEDIEALIKEIDSDVFIFGQSSGAALAMEAANKLGKKIKKLAVYEAPFVVDATYPPMADDYLTILKRMVAEEKRGDAVKFFMKRVGVPSFFLMIFPLMPVWPKLTAVAHTLPYDITLVEPYQKGKSLSAKQWSAVTIPTLVGVGGKSPVWMKNGMTELANVLPNAEEKVVEGQTHMLKPEAIVPVLKKFFLDEK